MFDVKKYVALARQCVAEGCVLLKNDNQVLPLKKGVQLATFGRSQFHYYKSGTGSGGGVHTSYVVSVLDAMKNSEDIILNEDVLLSYETWIKDNPFDMGSGWATEPWCQKEMPLTEELVKKAAAESDIAVITIARTAGEDKDNSAEEGSYLLSPGEEKMLEMVCRHFDKTIVLLNVGNIIDMKWVEKYKPSAVMYVWQGGQEGGNGVLDVLTGKVNPSGKLTDTIARHIKDYPSTSNFGAAKYNVYAEDIYVGYRYFETFKKDKVLYPFGFGLSYTNFDIQCLEFDWNEEGVSIKAQVTNTGSVTGKEVVQCYKEAPQGALGKPTRELCGFAKTKLLAPGESEKLTITCNKYYLASYDDIGASGHKSAYVLEKGLYRFFLGKDVRNTAKAGEFELEETILIEQLSPVMSPVVVFERICPLKAGNGYEIGHALVPTREYNLWDRIKTNRPKDIPYTGNKGYQLKDVREGKISMETFVAQIPTEQLCVLVRGEGMCSPKVTPGTGGAFGGLSPQLRELGIPIACCTDGPSGIRMDVGTIAFSLPNGTCLASTFNEQLNIELFEMLGLELRKNKVDVLLGPGMNLHRNPLNGRNFEYFSEDPFLAGKIATAQLKGLHRHGVTGTIKHFIGNNQEYKRHFANSVISERAIRELYLKSFEIACKEGGAYCIMSTYGQVNGLYTASNYDLLTHVLREEWGYQGLVMSDWWAKGNEEGEEGSQQENAAMVRSQNDIFMVVDDAEINSNHDNLMTSVNTDKLTLGELQRGAANVLNVLMNMPVMERYLDVEEQKYKALYEMIDIYDTDTDYPVIHIHKTGELPVEKICTEAGCRSKFVLQFAEQGSYKVDITLRAISISELAQMSMSIFIDGKFEKTISLKGTDKDWISFIVDIESRDAEDKKIEFLFGQSGLEMRDVKIWKNI